MSSLSTSAGEKDGSFHVEQPYTECLAHCLICGARELHPNLVATDHTVSHLPFTITRCNHCGAHFTNPRPSPEAIGEFYRSANYISHTDADKGLLARIYRIVRNRAIRSKLALLRPSHPAGRLLDIGCGTGAFLKAAARTGYAVTGVEPSPDARAIAQQGLSGNVHATLEQTSATEPYQIITMWHVLEHMHAPLDTLRQIRSRLSSDGILIIAVPNRESWDADHYGQQWAAWDVPRHLTHFSANDIRASLSRTGFRLRTTRPMWFDAPYVSILSELATGRGQPAAIIRGMFFGLLSNLVARFSDRPTSSTIYIAEPAEAH